MNRLLIFGCGYVGSACAWRALDEGWEVVAVTRNPGKAAALAAGGVQAVVADLAGAVRDLVELQVPLDALRLRAGDRIAFVVTLERGLDDSAHYPASGAIETAVPDANPVSTSWSEIGRAHV